MVIMTNMPKKYGMAQGEVAKLMHPQLYENYTVAGGLGFGVNGPTFAPSVIYLPQADSDHIPDVRRLDARYSDGGVTVLVPARIRDAVLGKMYRRLVKSPDVPRFKSFDDVSNFFDLRNVRFEIASADENYDSVRFRILKTFQKSGSVVLSAEMHDNEQLLYHFGEAVRPRDLIIDGLRKTSETCWAIFTPPHDLGASQAAEDPFLAEQIVNYIRELRLEKIRPNYAIEACHAERDSVLPSKQVVSQNIECLVPQLFPGGPYGVHALAYRLKMFVSAK